jgi:hypothetical protein
MYEICSLWGPGVAEYRLDVETGVVHVDWQYRSEPVIHRSGPIPIPVETSGKKSWASAGATLVFAFGTFVGMLAGYRAAAVDARDEMTFFGGLAGFLVAYVCAAVASTIAVIRRRHD